jgi:MoxR-like ATPase
MTGARLIRLQCYEGLDESKALYEWNYKKQLLRIQAERNDDGTWDDCRGRHLLRRVPAHPPAARGHPADDPVVLLIDEVDRVEVETEALLLEILSDYQVSIPELGTIEAKQIPLVFLTSNNTRELSEALKRRCLFLHVDYPDLEREKEIVLTKVPDITENLADQVARIVRSIRQLELKKAPSVSETLDWARTLLLLGVGADRRRDGHRAPSTSCSSTRATSPRRAQGALAAKRPPRHRPAGARRTGSVTGRPADRARAGEPMLELLAGFIQELREAGLPVSLTENLDAMEAVKHIPLEDREAFKYALAATLVKNNAHWRAFETVFEVYFSLRGREYARRRRRDLARARARRGARAPGQEGAGGPTRAGRRRGHGR